jgi:hypothetical protein
MKRGDARARETREWLAKAAEDLASARDLIGTGHFGNALFFCQQAAEKSPKAFLTWHGRVFQRTHDLEQVGEACCAIDARWLRSWNRPMFFRIMHGSCATPERPIRRNGKRPRPCSDLPAVFSWRSSRGFRWKPGLPKTMASTSHERRKTFELK